MRLRLRKKVGGLLFAAVLATPFWVSMRADAATPAVKVAPEESQNGVCTQADCSAPGSGEQATDADRKLGTAITWMPTPDAAWHAAVDEGKLVFMIQVSGNFARQEFT